MKGPKKFTVHIIPEDGEVREYTLTYRLVIFFAVLIFIVISAILYFSFNIGRVYIRNVDYRLMEKRVEELEDREREITRLNIKIRKLEELSSRLNRALGLGITPEEVHGSSEEVAGGNDSSPVYSANLEEQALQLREYIPDAMPATGGWISRGYTEEHEAIDISLPEGTSVYSTMRGKVYAVDDHRYLGKTIKIRNNEGFEILYGHLSKILVREDKDVEKGDLIALSGNTGRSDAPHLHYAIKVQGNWINPLNYLPTGGKNEK